MRLGINPKMADKVQTKNIKKVKTFQKLNLSGPEDPCGKKRDLFGIDRPKKQAKFKSDNQKSLLSQTF
jgi:hypothetical protein